jgi:ACS family glucarate transporter-like MFS transporter
MSVLTLRGMPVRYRILCLLFVLSFVNYLLRNNFSVAQPSIQDEFHFTNTQIGWIVGSFNSAYTLFQIPGGAFGNTVGPRRAFAIIATAWGILTAATGFVPGLIGASAAMVMLIAVRFVLGIANATMFPVAAGAIANWFPVGGWAFPNAALSSGLTLGQAAAGPIMALLVTSVGWRESFYVLAPVGVAAAAWWWWYGRDLPAEHPAVSAAEVAYIEAGRAPVTDLRGGWRTVLRNRDVLLLSASYLSMNYTFYIFSNWLFMYLVRERGFSTLEGGFLSALPFLTGAVLAAVGGVACDVACRRIGPRWGCRLPGIVGLAMVAWLLLAGAASPSPLLAVALLSLCFGFTQFTEGAYWQATTYVAGPHTATACGVLNTGGNLAGFLAPLVGFLVDQFGWWSALATGSGFAVVGALLWLFVQPDRGDAVRTGR